MIPSPYRLKLTSTNPFLGKKFYGQWALIISQPSSAPRWAVSISKKTAPLAVTRNRIRRQIVQFLYKNVAYSKPLHAHIVVRKAPTAENSDELLTEISQVLLNQTYV